MQNILVFLVRWPVFLSFFLSNLMVRESFFCVQSFCEQRVKTRMGEVAAASDLRSERQQARLEAFWLEKGADEAQGWFQSDGGALGSTAIGEPEPEKSTCSLGEAEEGAELGDPPNVPVQVDIFC